MVLPMMGFLFALFIVGVAVALITLLFRPLRRLTWFALIPILAAVTAFVGCWGLAVLLEALFGSDIGTYGFFAGYAVGGLGGAGLGGYLALRALTRAPT